mmetsp:Transcript_7812/g.21185  ORF Transcript_7812/g.21185 Transcript_7812/m.21185 type:complete len:212 (+) Transcript_7812:291-926(+)
MGRHHVQGSMRRLWVPLTPCCRLREGDEAPDAVQQRCAGGALRCLVDREPALAGQQGQVDGLHGNGGGVPGPCLRAPVLQGLGQSRAPHLCVRRLGRRLRRARARRGGGGGGGRGQRCLGDPGPGPRRLPHRSDAGHPRAPGPGLGGPGRGAAAGGGFESADGPRRREQRQSDVHDALGVDLWLEGHGIRFRLQLHGQEPQRGCQRSPAAD